MPKRLARRLSQRALNRQSVLDSIAQHVNVDAILLWLTQQMGGVGRQTRTSGIDSVLVALCVLANIGMAILPDL